MSLVNYNFVALLDSDPSGQNTAPFQAVEVRNESDGLFPTIYSDSAGTSPITQPGANTDSAGVFSFWVLPGYYVITSGSRTENIYVDNGSRLRQPTLAAAEAAVKQYKIGEVLELTERTAGNGGGAKWQVVDATTVTENGFDIIVGDATRSFQYIQETPINANALGAFEGESTAAIQAAIDLLPAGKDGGGVVSLDHTLNYITSGSGIIIPNNVTLDCNNARITYTGTGVAFTLGTSATVRTAEPRLLNLNLLLSDKTSTGVKLWAAVHAEVTGYIESTYAPFDNTRTNVGVHIDAGNASSFFNKIEVMCNHTHESFRVLTTGTTFATNTLFLNCSAFGDHGTDTTSIGYNIGVGNTKPEGQGMQIVGGNIEQCSVGIDIGNFSGPAAIMGVRFEGGSNTTDVRVRNATGTPHTFIGNALMERVTYDFPSANRSVHFNENGQLGVVGGRQGIVGAIVLDKSGDKNGEGNFNILTDGGATSTGSIAHQAGNGSANNGGGWRSYAAAHATYPGDMTCFTSGSGIFRVAAGFNEGGNFFRALSGSVTAGVDNVSSSGSISFRYTELFSVNATINTSDARLKTKVKPLSNREVAASKDILELIGGWQWLAKVAEEGENARIHYGPTVQAVISALNNNKIEPFSCSFVCYDEWEDVYESRGVTDDDGFQKSDKNGNPIFEEYLLRPAGDMYSLRKSELLMFLVAGIGARMNAAGI